MKSTLTKLSVVGLGKLGLCTAAYFAARGHPVTAVDKDARTVEQLRLRRCPTRERGLPELLEESWENLEVTTNIRDAVLRSDVTLIIVPTPSDVGGMFSNEHVVAVLREIAPVLKSRDSFHVVDVVSTVMPGSSESVFGPMLEGLSGKRCGRDFGLVYNPEFIALGSVIDDFSRPDMVLIGASDEKSAGIVRDVYAGSCLNNPHFAVMSLLNAEITKLSLNCFVTTKISFANELASICERIAGADVDAITDAIGSDSRVGDKYLRAGLGFGGTCFPRDNVAFRAFARSVGHEARISGATISVNDSVVDRLFEQLCSRVPERGRISLLGLSYKPGTHITEKSQSMELAGRLVDAGYSVSVHDPAAMEEAAAEFNGHLTYHPDPYECTAGTDAIVLLTRWPQYGELDWDRIERDASDGAFVLDSWRDLKDFAFRRMNYSGLGLGRVCQ